jgi:hypothetical protein
MARLEPEAFADRELERVFIAASLAEALRVESVLGRCGVDYVVQVEILGRTLFGSERLGAAFYVVDGQASYCRLQLAAAGFAPGRIDGDPD